MRRHPNLTYHARQRLQQRGIDDVKVQLLLAFGEDRYQKGGSTLTAISEKTVTRIRAALDGLAGIVLIKSESESIVTALHRQRPIRSTEYVA